MYAVYNMHSATYSTQPTARGVLRATLHCCTAHPHAVCDLCIATLVQAERACVPVIMEERGREIRLRWRTQ